MTDTGQIPGEGLPENAGMVEQPGIPAPDAYTYLEPSEHTAEDDDLLLMPASQGAWSDAPAAPEQLPAHTPAPVPAAAAPARRPLHRGPASPEAPSYGGTPTGGVVRSLADRGPAGPQNPMPVRHAGPPATSPEHFGVPADDAAALPGPQLGETPPQGAPAWGPPPEPAAEPEQAVASEPATAPETVVAPAEASAPPLEPAEPVESFAPAAPADVAPLAPDVAVASAETVAPEPVAAVLPEAPAEPASETAEEPPVEALAEVPETVPVDAPAELPAEAAPVETPPVETPPVETPAVETPTAEAAAPTEPVEQFELVADPVPTASQLAPIAVVEQAADPEPQPVPPVEESLPAGPEASGAPEAVTVEQPEAQPEDVPEARPELPAEPDPAPEPVAVPPSGAQTLTGAEPGAGPEVTGTPETGIPESAVSEIEASVFEAPEVEAPEAVSPESVVPEAQPLTAEAPAAAAPAPAAEAQAPVQEAPEEAPLVEVAGGTEATEATAPAEAEAEPEEAPASPPAPGYDDAEREAVLRVMRERRDIRNGFRGDPIPNEVLLRVLEAAHTAPSVGHSQPWDFVVIRSAETRRSMHELAQRQREAYAQSLPKARAKQFKELKIEAILDTPVNIVVTADPTRGGRHTLGRHTQPQMAPYSSALAVENLWLAARAEGLGVGWVSFFDEREMVRALGLPEHLEVVAYLCVGYVDEFPEEPELMQAGWSKRRPLSWVVHEETYGRRALPGEEPHNLLQETISSIRPLDAKALGQAWERQKRMTKPAGALGMLEIISAQLSGLSRMCPPPIPEPAAVGIFAGDHGVHAQGVTAWPQEVTGQMVANFLGGGAVCNAFAVQVGAEVCVVDVGVAADLPTAPGLLPRKVRPGTADFTTGPAMTREDVLAAIEVGIETARDLVAAGNKALLTGEMGIANTTASAALICVYTGMDPAEVTGRGTGINDEMHARKVDVVRRGLGLHQPDPADPIGVLAAVGGLEHAAMAGFLLGGASLRTPVILDGVSAGAAALVARAIAPEALAACIAGHRSAEPGHVAALNKLGLRPLVDLDLRLGEGTGALLALPIVQSAARAMHEVATFDSAGVTEK
ncbi:nicotinate-nucleotide--dimethylbenzimidazole phosphoribosyltransferase [Streptomyces sp. NPDC005790]|uniref:nicotinate-nucleotide--dimethylbenzimidazole phosphoribosyltransferase n=1 Tax=Streptomyces sp. NPDC005790 TaxID=3154777 RepID=UPI0033FCBC16